MGDQKWVCDFPEGKRICALQGDTISSAYNSNTKLCTGVGTDCLRDVQPL